MSSSVADMSIAGYPLALAAAHALRDGASAASPEGAALDARLGCCRLTRS